MPKTEKIPNDRGRSSPTATARPCDPGQGDASPCGGLGGRAPKVLTKDTKAATAAELAYLGDAVFELFVREKLLREGVPFRKISRRAKDFVSAPAQAAMYHRIFDGLSEEEQAVMKRGRNLHSTSRAKNAEVSEYRHATGLEALFGFLHAKGDAARLCEIFELCTGG